MWHILLDIHYIPNNNIVMLHALFASKIKDVFGGIIDGARAKTETA
jgi:hypothetical protein